MKNLLFLICSLLTTQFCIAQSKTILVFDLVNNTVDSIESIVFDTSIHEGKTDFSFGLYPGNTAQLEQTTPTQNTSPNAKYTKKIRAADKFDLTQYPIRTSIKIFNVVGDTFKTKCSGSMISRRHVLSASHCFSDYNTSSIFVNKLYVCPVYNDGKPSTNFHCSYVSKIYQYKNWTFNGEDITVLELEEPIGQVTGWLGIGFNDDDSFFSQGIYHKFSYPGVNDYYTTEDSTPYNGDTLYHSYGKINTSNGYMAADGATSQRGESGSSIIRVLNNQDYTSYGVLSFIPFSHNTIFQRAFNDIRSIISNDLFIDYKSNTFEHFNVFPNPASDFVQVKKFNSYWDVTIEIYNSLGEQVFERVTSDLHSTIDVSCLIDGIYFLRIKGIDKTETVKLLKATL